MTAAAGLGLLTLIAQVEIAGQTRVLLLDDCPAGLDGFYAPARNRIGLCRNNHSSDAALKSTLRRKRLCPTIGTGYNQIAGRAPQ